MAKVDRLAYLVFEVGNLDRWRAFMATLYGLELRPVAECSEHEAAVDADGSRLVFREGPAEDLVAVGWLAEDLDGMHERLTAAGANASWADRGYAALRGAGRVLQTEDPTGLGVDIVEETASHNPFEPAGHGHRYVTGELGVGHLTFASRDLVGFERFLTEGLGLRVTDYNNIDLGPGFSVRVGFYRANRRHHTVACGTMEIPGQRLQHFFLEVPDRATVDAAYERVLRARIPVAHRIGQHPNDELYTFYVVSPSGFQAEIGAEALLVEDDRPVGYWEGMSNWGHEMPVAQKVRMARVAAHNIGGRLRNRLTGVAEPALPEWKGP